MGWLPEWLAKRYAQLYYRFTTEPFDFDSAQGLLGYNKLEVRRTLAQLENAGFLHKGRQPTDLRRKNYYLVNPEHAIRAFALQSENIDERLRLAGSDFQYVVTGAAAAYKYHGYMTPAKIDILVFKKDLGFWYALLKGKETPVAIDHILAEKRGQIIHLHTTLTQEIMVRAVKIGGIFYTSADDLVLEFFRHPTDTSLLDAIAIMLTHTKDLDWDLLSKSDVKQEIGFVMEVLNKEAAKTIFTTRLLGRFKETEKIVKRFSTRDELLELPEDYYALTKDWNLEINVPVRIFRKAIEDLVS